MTNRPRTTPHKLHVCTLEKLPTLEGEAGGKAWGLYKAQKLGLDVPPTLVISALSFWPMLKASVLASSSLTDLQESLHKLSPPSSWHQEISPFLTPLYALSSSKTLAVRSSAASEDGQEHSFAGQQHTVLGCTSQDEVLQATFEILAHLYNPNITTYQAQSGIERPDLGLGLVIQPMVHGEVSGVMFTHDPLNKTSNVLLVTATDGLAQGVVEGKEGRTFYIDKTTGKQVWPHSSGESEECFPRENPLLCAKLHEVYLRLGDPSPCDLEWTLVEGAAQVTILQMRPASLASDPGRPQIWTNTNVGEALPGVGTPMTWSIIKRFSERGFQRAFGAMGLEVPEGANLVGAWQGRVYLNLSEFMGIAAKVPVMSPERLWRLAGGSELTPQMREHLPAPGGGVQVETLVNMMQQLPKLVVDWGIAPHGIKAWEAKFLHQREALFSRDLERLTHHELADQVRQHDTWFSQNGERMLAISASFLLGYVALRTWMEARLGGEDAERLALGMMSGMKLRSGEPARRLLALARLAKESDALTQALESWAKRAPTRPQMWGKSAAFARAFEDLLKRDGERARGEAELSVPRWREDPRFLFETVLGYVSLPSLPKEGSAVNRDAAREELRERLGWVEFQALDAFWRGRRRDAGRREVLRALVVDSLGMYRHLFLEAGRRLKKMDVLPSVEEVFYLRHEEVLALLEEPPSSRDVVHAKLCALVRRDNVSAQRKIPSPPATFLARGAQIVPQATQSPEHDGTGALELRGLPGAPGKVQGRAHLVTSQTPLSWGDVLVMPYADVGWTPLFLRASALVVELGGPLSHACIVAREYGIPTVVNVTGAMGHIKQGDVVFVDGRAGVVRVSASG